jgi:ornithine cyclodeaminase/alanine dehydrogenase-like protein (mu-crystallin family)
MLPCRPKSSVFSLQLKNVECKIAILPSVLYGRESSSPILREVHKLRVFENSMLRIIFGYMRNEIIGLKNLNNWEHHNSHCSPNIIGIIISREKRWAAHVASMDAKLIQSFRQKT